MRVDLTVRAFGPAAVALALLAGCSGGSAIAPRVAAPQSHTISSIGRIPVVVNPIGGLKANLNAGHHFKAFNHCPAVGPIAYVSDFQNSVINIYKIPFAGQAPCGKLVDGLLEPEGLFVRGSTHELYVANTGGYDVVVFRRGASSPFKIYTDPTVQFPADVTVANDGTVIATNLFPVSKTEPGSLSTWHKDGTFVGNFPNPNRTEDLFLTVQKDGTVYFDDLGLNLNRGSCPAGVCGSFTATGATFILPGGLRSADGEDVVAQEQLGPGRGGGEMLTYEPPDFTSPASCALNAGDPVGFDISRPQHHYFYADATNNVAVEIDYPTCTLIGKVPGNAGGQPIGVAKDEPETL